MPAGTGNANFLDWAVMNGRNALESRLIFGNSPGSPLARVDTSSAGIYYTLTDRQGSVQMVIDGGPDELTIKWVASVYARDAAGKIISAGVKVTQFKKQRSE